MLAKLAVSSYLGAICTQTFVLNPKSLAIMIESEPIIGDFLSFDFLLLGMTLILLGCCNHPLRIVTLPRLLTRLFFVFGLLFQFTILVLVLAIAVIFVLSVKALLVIPKPKSWHLGSQACSTASDGPNCHSKWRHA